MKKIAIGIDPGKNTGFALKDLATGEFLSVETLLLHEAIEKIVQLHKKEGIRLYAVVEDARKRKWINDAHLSESRKKGLRQGAGSVKRDCTIWEDFFTDYGIPLHLQKPKKGGTKVKSWYFKRLTGWKNRTSEHGRDAGMLIEGLNTRNLRLFFPEKGKK